MCKKRGYKHTAECQFYVTTAAPLSFLDNKYVVFGRVISGMRAFKMIEKLDIINERPVKTVKIVDAGDYSITKKREPLPSVAKIKKEEPAKDQPSSVAEKTS